MWITGREAARRLRVVLSSDEQVRILLRTEIAGPGVATSSGPIFEEDAIEAVRVRPVVDSAEVADLVELAEDGPDS